MRQGWPATFTTRTQTLDEAATEAALAFTAFFGHNRFVMRAIESVRETDRIHNSAGQVVSESFEWSTTWEARPDGVSPYATERPTA